MKNNISNWVTPAKSATPKHVVGIPRRLSHLAILFMASLVTSQSVFAADDNSTFLNLGIPGWILGLVVVAILIGVALIPIKPKDGQTHELPLNKNKQTPPTPKTETTAPTIETPQAPEVVVESPIEPIKASAVIAAEVTEEPVIAVDVLQEAKQLLVQQRFPQAVGVLSKGLQKEPERSDLMLELLAIHLKQNDHESFDAQFEQLQKLDDPIALIQAEELRDQIERKPEPTDDSGFIDFHSSKTPTPVVAESVTPPVEIQHDSLAFTLDEPTPAPAATPASSENDFPSLDHEFKLDTIDDIHTLDSAIDAEILPVQEQPLAFTPTESPASTAKDKDVVTFDASDLSFDDIDFKPNEVKDTPSIDHAVVAPEVKHAEPLAALESNTPLHIEGELVDLEFDLDESFALDQDKQEAKTEAGLDWTTDLADENFALPTVATPNIVETEVAAVPVAALPVESTVTADISPADNLLSSLESEFPFLKSIDAHQTRLDLARNYIALGELNSARELLSEVAAQGATAQQTEARELISKLAS